MPYTFFPSCLSLRMGVPILKVQDQNHLGLNKQFSSKFLLTYFTCIISFSVNIKLYLVHTTFWQWIMVRNSYVNLRCRKNYIFSIWGADTLKLANRICKYLCTLAAKKDAPTIKEKTFEMGSIWERKTYPKNPDYPFNW